MFAVGGIGTESLDPVDELALGGPIVVGAEQKAVGRPLGHEAARFWRGLVGSEDCRVEEAAAVEKAIHGMGGRSGETAKMRRHETMGEPRNVVEKRSYLRRATFYGLGEIAGVESTMADDYQPGVAD